MIKRGAFGSRTTPRPDHSKTKLAEHHAYIMWEEDLEMPFLYLNKKYLWSLGDTKYLQNAIARSRLLLNICAGLLEDALVAESNFCD